MRMPTTGKKQFWKPDVWGGMECTIARIEDGYIDQLQLAGHYSRPGDIDCIAALGVKALRCPVLWERHQPDLSGAADWTWADRQLAAIRENGIVPIVGLLHHGSGPSYTSLIDPAFADGIADYAASVAKRYPWVEYYTPINEPLTTARFSGLYGIWYPHLKDDASFARMLIHQVTGIVRAMQAIRRINPAAKLVQTEDLAKVHSTPLLAYQADFENHRRWLTYDLLCGKVDRGHSLYGYLMSAGIREEELSYLTEHPCVPHLLGVNYYVTSERYLDEQLDNYPGRAHGGNGRHRYADVAAVHEGKNAGIFKLLAELYERYQLPIAITEVHMHCTREEQVRWFHEIWKAACAARRAGVDVRAVTSWALLGAYDWDSLLTRQAGNYECGAYAIEGGELRITAIGYLLQELAAGRCPDHPLLDSPGWWNTCSSGGGRERLLVIGVGGETCELVMQLCSQRNISAVFAPTPAEAEVFLSGEQRIWGVIEIADMGNAVFPEACEETGLPYLCMEPHRTADNRFLEIQGLLDRFVDRAIELACGQACTQPEKIHLSSSDKLYKADWNYVKE